MKRLAILMLLAAAGGTTALELDITLSFPGRPADSIHARGATEYLTPDSLLVLDGLKATWTEGEIFDVKDLPVLWDQKRENLRFRIESDSLKVYYGDEQGPPQQGKFKLDQPFRLVGPGVMLKLDRGRYFFEGAEMKLFLAGSAWKRGARGFLMAAFIGVITLILLINGRRTRQRLESERGSVKKPRMP